MKANKLELEKLIKQRKTLGNYVFNEIEKCFFCDTEIVLCLSNISTNTFESELYFWDGYEVAIDDDQKERYNGNKEDAKKKVIEHFKSSPEIFMGFPIIYTNVSCEIND